MLNLHCFCATFLNIRTNNEDNFYFNNYYAEKIHTDEAYEAVLTDKKPQLFAVFDGLGGEENGELASYIAAKTLASLNTTDGYYAEANKNICGANKNYPTKTSGTTAVIISVYNECFSCSNIGDSRAYVIRNKEIIRLSVDHTSLQALLSAGVITKEQAEKSKYKNTLSQCLGADEDNIKINPHIGETELIEDGDIFLLCSDGLTNLDDDEIKKIILSSPKESVCQRLFNSAVSAGSKDNITIIVIYASKEKNIFEKLKRSINRLCGK